MNVQCLGCNTIVRMVNGRKSPCACDVGAEFRPHVAYKEMRHRHQNVGRQHTVSTVDYTQDIWARADERAYGPQPQPKQHVPVRECVWACDCKVGNGNRNALVHAVGCASQAAVAREAVLVETCDGA